MHWSQIDHLTIYFDVTLQIFGLVYSIAQVWCYTMLS